MSRFSPLREEIRRALHELRGGELSPWRGAAAVALGLFVGCLPFFGFHLAIVLGVCLLLRLDAVLAYLAANISNPFFLPVLLTAEVELGIYLRTGSRPRFAHLLSTEGAFGFARDLFIGAPVLGAFLALAGGLLTFVALTVARFARPADKGRAPYRLPESAPPWFDAVERVAGRYSASEGESAAERSRFHYVRVKLLLDPVAQMIADRGGTTAGALGEVLDIGTGRGQLPILLLELGRATRATGIDWDEDKIEAASRAAQAQGELPALAASFTVGDAKTAAFPKADTVLLIDLLHYFTIEEQDAILVRAAAAVRPKGRLLVREADLDRGLRSTFTLLEERFFTALRFNRGARVRFRRAREITAILEANGLSCEVCPAWGRTPFSNVLIVGTSQLAHADPK